VRDTRERDSAGDRDRPERLRTADAYRLWAPTYARETAVSALEDRIVQGVMPRVHARRLLDVGCGTGRRLDAVAEGSALSVGVDLVPEMLEAGSPRRSGLRIAGDVRALPVRSDSFDLVWCRLVLGHVRDLDAAYAELGRVSRPGADLIVSDFHVAAVAAGHTRTFRDASGQVREVEHHPHTPGAHESTARSSGWNMARMIEAPAGAEERDYYERAGRLAQLESEADLPLVLVMCFRR
jgi:malonyl-CoA O-methyltransferase